jgi:hypothetical protein
VEYLGEVVGNWRGGDEGYRLGMLDKRREYRLLRLGVEL